jgi:hypothetical protein
MYSTVEIKSLITPFFFITLHYDKARFSKEPGRWHSGYTQLSIKRILAKSKTLMINKLINFIDYFVLCFKAFSRIYYLGKQTPSTCTLFQQMSGVKDGNH